MSISEAISTVVTAGPENVLGKDTGLFAEIKQYFVDFADTMKSNNYAFNVFEKNLLFIKAFALIAIVLMACVSFYYYRNTGLIKKQPYVFACESFIFALSALLPFLMVCYLRNQRYNVNQITMISIVLFIVMFENPLFEEVPLVPVPFCINPLYPITPLIVTVLLPPSNLIYSEPIIK